MNRKKIVITSGEPSGIGPDLTLELPKLLKSKELKDIDCLVLADPELIKDRAKRLNKTIEIEQITKDGISKDFDSSKLNILPVPELDSITPGKLNVKNSPYVMNMLDTAIELCLSNTCDSMLTCPIQKSILIEAGYSLQGHTEYLAEKCEVDQVVMMLANQHLRVALVSTHIPLNQVSTFLSKDKIQRVIRILNQDLQSKFKIAQPNIYVCGLNPHAGENGHLGTEEQEFIEPALEELRNEGIKCIGPLPADTAFSLDNRKNADAFVAMYHDQGLPVLKALGFGDSINITLGLPIIRTSVDHGTALDLAGTNKTNHGSFIAALEQAAELS